MRFTTSVVLFLASAGLLEAATAGRRSHSHKASPVRRQNRQGGNNNGGSATCLSANALQTGSDLTGQEAGSTGIATGQSPSATDPANFLNFCAGQTLTNGKQNTDGSCNGIPMGKIPSKANMISAIITNPQPGDQVTALTTFNISVQTQKLSAGVFTNPQLTYYSAPQNLDNQGQIIGHCHVTVQSLGNSLRTTTPPDPTTFAFFKGIDDAGNGRGLLQATITGGLPAGFYRVCTLIGAANHQPVIMPVAQRGAQDDCTKFEVVAAAGNGNGNGNANTGGNGNGNGNANTGGNGNAAASSTSAAAAAATSATNANTGGGRGGKGGKGASSTSAVAAAVSSAASNAGNGNVAIPTIKSGTLGGAAPAITFSGNAARPFSVNGNTFVNAAAAIQRVCDIQFNQCADAANGGRLNGKTVNDCQTQKNGCGAQ